MAARFELVLDETGKFHFQLRGSDGSVLMSSPGCASKIMAQNGVMHARSALRDANNVVSHADKDGKHVLVLVDKDGAILARTAPLAAPDSTSVAERICLDAHKAPLVDATKRQLRQAQS